MPNIKSFWHSSKALYLLEYGEKGWEGVEAAKAFVCRLFLQIVKTPMTFLDF